MLCMKHIFHAKLTGRVGTDSLFAPLSPVLAKCSFNSIKNKELQRTLVWAYTFCFWITSEPFCPFLTDHKICANPAGAKDTGWSCTIQGGLGLMVIIFHLAVFSSFYNRCQLFVLCYHGLYLSPEWSVSSQSHEQSNFYITESYIIFYWFHFLSRSQGSPRNNFSPPQVSAVGKKGMHSPHCRHTVLFYSGFTVRTTTHCSPTALRAGWMKYCDHFKRVVLSAVICRHS